MNGREMTDAEAEQSMRLPEGKTCGDCKHIRRCELFGYTDDRANTTCDFAPSRFAPASGGGEPKETDRG